MWCRGGCGQDGREGGFRREMTELKASVSKITLQARLLNVDRGSVRDTQRDRLVREL